MSSKGDHRRRDRSWEKEDRDRDRDRDRHGGSSRGGRSHRDDPRRRSSRSRSPRRDRDGDRRGSDRRDRDRDYRYDHDRDRRNDRDRDRYADDRRRDRDDSRRDGTRRDDRDGYSRDDKYAGRDGALPLNTESSKNTPTSSLVQSKLEPDAPNDSGEPMDDINDDDAAIMAMMGVTGFGTTKGKHVEGNQEGAVNIKKVRTWRQYMNRRGGFNRPLDKIK